MMNKHTFAAPSVSERALFLTRLGNISEGGVLGLVGVTVFVVQNAGFEVAWLR
jgi:hypothetical protein